MKVLVAGWFSFEEMGATAGDLMARDVACTWLEQAGHAYDIAVAAPFTEGIDWQTVDPQAYSHVIFVCGPFGNGPPITDFLPRFAHCKLIGLDLSMLEPLEVWNPFDLLLERDSSRRAHPDLAFLAPPSQTPVVGLVLIHPQAEYGKRDIQETANGALQCLAASRPMARVTIDTRLDRNYTGLRTAGEVEALIARMDVVLTTRLHGLVLAIKNGVPAVVIDPVAGGAKIQRQAQTIGWPIVFPGDAVSQESLQEAFSYCLTEAARTAARECATRARQTLAAKRMEFLGAL
jgi:hypothetical protein